MLATRVRFGSAIEWVLAAVVFVAIVAIGSGIIRELRRVSASIPVSAREAQPRLSSQPAGLPARAVSVPVLLLPGGRSVHIGDTVAAIAARLGREAEVGTQAVERARFGERLTRFYERDGARFVLVFEAMEAGGVMRVAGIYLR